MKNILLNQRIIEKYEAEFGGIFSLSDLKNLISAKNPVLLYREIKKLETYQILSRFSRGFYVTPNFKLEVLSQRLAPRSYLSLGTVLAKELLIGSIPQKTIYAIKIGKNRSYQNNQAKVVHLGITPQLFFGYDIKNGIAYANKEKAFLDTLYFYQKGQKYSFNIYQDINMDLLDRNILDKYLKKYKNPKFKKFVKGLLYG